MLNDSTVRFECRHMQDADNTGNIQPSSVIGDVLAGRAVVGGDKGGRFEVTCRCNKLHLNH